MSKRPLIIGTALLVIGVLGMGVLMYFTTSSARRATNPSPVSSGERIYYTGTDARGREIPRTVAGVGLGGPGMMASNLPCADCHGQDGRGGVVSMMMGSFEIPDIRYSALTTAHSEEGTVVPAWTDADIERAIVDGIEPDGERLQAPMPRWHLTNAEVRDVIAYLKELSRR